MKLLTHPKPFFIPGTCLILSIALTGCGGVSSKKQDSPPTVTSVSSATSSSLAISSSSSSSMTTSSSSVVSSSALSRSTSSSSKSSSSASSSSLVAKTGVFVDSAVQGLHYETTPSGFSGTTSANGEYQYAEGDTVIFSIGKLLFPSVTAKGVVTPLDMAHTINAHNQIALNIAALLQSLDIDGNPDNGISINSAVASLNATPFNFDLSYADFAALTAVKTLVSTSGSSNSTLTSETVTLAHIEESLNKLQEGLIGTWTIAGGKDKFIFSDYKTFTHIKLISDDPINCSAGTAKGTYSWDPDTYDFNVTLLSDTTITEAGGSCAVGGSSKLILDGDDLILINEAGSFLFSKGTSNTEHSLVGTWSLKTATGYATLTFTDTTYFISDYDSSGIDNAPLYGSESGTYTYSAGIVNVTVLVDQNGSRGFSSKTNWPITFSNSGNRFTTGDFAGSVVLERVK